MSVVAVTIRKDIRLGDQNEHLYILDITPSSSYPSGGEPIDPTGNSVLECVDVVGGGTGYVFDWDFANQKLKIFRRGSHTHDFKIIGGQAAAGTDAVSAKTLTLGKEAATNITIAGANSGTLGGVVAQAASALEEVTAAVDLSALRLVATAIGS